MGRCHQGCCNNDDELDSDIEMFDEFDDEEEKTVPCPYCGVEIDDEAEVCPSCGIFILEENRPSTPMWVVWTALILLALIFSGLTCLL